VLEALVVFAQRAGADVDAAGWDAHAQRFFATGLGLVDSGPQDPGQAAAGVTFRFVIIPRAAPQGIRAVTVRGAAEEDFFQAEQADVRAGGGGLALVARRCRAVWLVEREALVDSLSLRLAAILASVLLGPILDTVSEELFAVKTARAKIEAAGR
jgi:hypothetical protein